VTLTATSRRKEAAEEGPAPADAASGATTYAQQAGQAGEAAAGIVKNSTRIPSLSNTAAYRVPDVLDRTAGVIGEVKNTAYQSYTAQLRDLVRFAKDPDQGLSPLLLWTRPDTELSDPLQDAIDRGDIIRRFIGK
jgi:Restriction endonuclease fold toxin 7